MKEKILHLLSNIHEAKEAIEINDMLGLTTAAEYKELQDTLNELVSDYTIFLTKKGKYLLLKNCPGIKIGRLSLNKKGFGFIILDKEDDLYVSEDNINDAIDGDIVMVEVFTSGVRKEGKVLRVVKRELDNLVGEIITLAISLAVPRNSLSAVSVINLAPA